MKLIAVYEGKLRRDLCNRCYVRYYEVAVPEYISGGQYVRYKMSKVIKEIREERKLSISEGE